MPAARTEEPARQHVLPRVLNRRAECLRLQGTASDNVAHHRPDTGTRRLQDSDVGVSFGLLTLFSGGTLVCPESFLEGGGILARSGTVSIATEAA